MQCYGTIKFLILGERQVCLYRSRIRKNPVTSEFLRIQLRPVVDFYLPLALGLLLCSRLVGSGILFADDSLMGPTAMRTLTSSLLREEAVAKTEEEKADAIIALCDLYAAIRLHPQYDKSEMLRGEGVRVRRRLLSINQQLSDRLTRNKVVPPSDMTSRIDALLASHLVPSDPVPMNSASNDRGGAAPAGIGAEGWELVELIQRTVHPDFWASTGGPGSVRYFALKRVLVVRATTTVHEDLAAFLRRL
jgi:hypothetical protein